MGLAQRSFAYGRASGLTHQPAMNATRIHPCARLCGRLVDIISAPPFAPAPRKCALAHLPCFKTKRTEKYARDNKCNSTDKEINMTIKEIE